MSNHEVKDIDNGMVRVSVTCIECNQLKQFDVRKSGYDRWVCGGLIQRALPEVPVNEREILISGMCGDCFDKAFAEDEE